MNKQLKCPCCGARLLDEAEHSKSEVRVANSKSDWKADYYTKCRRCKKEIGLRKLNKD